MTSSLFSDLLVVDCASFIAGPAAATIMSDFGARVIKIEPPGLGDSYRNVFRLRGPAEDDIDYFWAVDSRNKESLAVDLKHPSARSALETLLKKADVFITNYPFPIRQRLRIRPDDLLPMNERLIYASLTPYGETGPDRDRTGYNSTAWWARSGLMDMVRPEPGAESAWCLPGMGDHPTASAMYGAILTALYRRQITGKGGFVSTSLMANGVWANACQVQGALCGYELTGRAPRAARGAFNETYFSQDEREFLVVTTNPARDWPALCRAVGHPEWLEDERFASPRERMLNGRVLVDLLADIFAADTFDNWRRRLEAGGVTFGLVGRIYDHVSDPQMEANGVLPEFEDGFGLRTIDSPFHVAGEEKVQPRMAPSIGQHTRQILEECGLAEAEIQALTAPA